MSKNQLFIIRAIMAAGFGVLISRFFYPEASIVFVVGLCAALVALAYLTEYLRHRSKARSDNKPKNGK